jgi:hypothetical protein
MRRYSWLARSLLVMAGAAAVGLLAMCGKAYVPPPVTPDLLTKGKAMYPDLTEDELKLGREVLVTTCSSCHKPPPPSYRTPAQWPKVIARMGKKGKIEEAKQKAVLRLLLVLR